MIGKNKKDKSESDKVYDGNWNFINPRWPVFLIIISYGVQLLLHRVVGYIGFRISDNIIVKQAITTLGHEKEITGFDIALVIVYIALIIAIIYISVFILPSDKKHDRIRLAGIFVMVGLLFKVVFALVNIRSLWIEIGDSFRMPMVTCGDLYIIGGLIAILIIFNKKYSNQELEEIISDWKNRRKKRE